MYDNSNSNSYGNDGGEFIEPDGVKPGQNALLPATADISSTCRNRHAPASELNHEFPGDFKQVGGWAAWCECPDGGKYLVGDRNDVCRSLACIGGKMIGGSCATSVRQKHERFGVVCCCQDAFCNDENSSGLSGACANSARRVSSPTYFCFFESVITLTSSFGRLDRFRNRRTKYSGHHRVNYANRRVNRTSSTRLQRCHGY